MNKITTLTVAGFVVLLMLSVMPANAIREVSSFESASFIVTTDGYETNPDYVNFTANQLPMAFLDIDEVDFNGSTQGESVSFYLSDKNTIDKDNFTYTSRAWVVDDRQNIAWLGEQYLAVGNDSTKLSKYLVDFESDEDITLRQGDVWDLGEGFTLVVQDVDVEGTKVWLILEQDGSSIADIVAEDDEYGYYNETVAGQSDTVVAKIHVDKVFSGQTANMAIIDDAEVISLDVFELDDDTYFGMDFDSDSSDDDVADTWLELVEDNSISLSKGKTKEIIPDFLSIRVGDTDSGEDTRIYLYNEVQVGEVQVVTTPEEEVTATPTETQAAGNETVGNETGAVEGTTVMPTEETTPEPTQTEPGFEAVFAIAGLLAVAYLVLRKRE